LFFLLRDRRLALQSLRELLPLSNREADVLLRRIRDTIHATVFGTVVVAIVQGTLGGLMFWLLGLPGALLWGVIMALLALIPVLGAFVVWVPAAIFLAVEGSWGKALLLTGWGTLVVGTIDNLLYPLLVGNKLRLHTLPVFFAIVGGLAVFGAAGVILGPVVLAVTLGLIDIWKSRTRAGHGAEEAVANA
jgi:predicted PurR-regulated permease PerM